MPWRPAGPPDTANELGELQASEVLDISRLGEEISASLQCRNCEQNCTRNPPRHKWEYMRVEPQVMATPATPGELRVKFECANCESIHIAEALPWKGLSPDGSRWSMSDAAVQWVFGSVHVHRSRATVTPRRANRMTAGASETLAPDSVQLAADEIARDRSAARQRVVGGAAGTVQAHGHGQGATGEGQTARKAAAVLRAVKAKAPGRNPANPTE